MIDENLARHDLSDAERAHALSRRKTIYETLHPEAANGSNQHNRVRQFGEPSADRFTAEAAKLTGRSERVVQRDCARGETLGDLGGGDAETGQMKPILYNVQEREEAPSDTSAEADLRKPQKAADKYKDGAAEQLAEAVEGRKSVHRAGVLQRISSGFPRLLLAAASRKDRGMLGSHGRSAFVSASTDSSSARPSSARPSSAAWAKPMRVTRSTAAGAKAAEVRRARSSTAVTPALKARVSAAVTVQAPCP